MASELTTEHKLERCLFSVSELGGRIDYLEQQLAQVQEDKQLYYDSWLSVCKERDALLEEMQRLREQAQERYEALQEREAQARALLESLIMVEPVGYGAESSTRYCPYCSGSDGGSDEPEYDPVEHRPDCPWLRARAFLAREEGE